MPRPEVGTPKWISNQMRKKGKTKLRWFCGLCHVPCRDENGFKCHLESEAHINKELVQLSEDAIKEYTVDDFSDKFMKHFLQILAHRHLNERMPAHMVYDEMCPHDRPHNTMKRTCWETLGRFVVYLRDHNKVFAERTIKGWQVTLYQDMVALSDEEEDVAPLPQKKKKTKWNEVQYPKIEGKPMKPGDASAKLPAKEEVAKPTERISDAKVSFSLNLSGGGGDAKKPVAAVEAAPQAEPANEEPEDDAPSDVEEEPQESKKRRRPEPPAGSWVMEGMVVKVVDKKNPEWHKRKCVITEAWAEGDVAQVDVLAADKTKDKLASVPEKKLETVIPQCDGEVVVCGGEHKGKLGTLKALDLKKFSGTINLTGSGETLSLPYEHFCKIDPSKFK